MREKRFVSVLYRGSRLSFAQKVTTLSPWLWWKTNETSGTTITDYGSGSNDGTLTIGSGSLNQAGPTSDTKSILFDGTATQITKTLTFADAQGREGTLLWWQKNEAAYWTDNTFRRTRVYKDASNNLLVGKLNNNQLQFQYVAGGTTVNATITSPNTTTGWFLMAATWSLSGDAAKCYQILQGGSTVVSASASTVGTYTGGASTLFQVTYGGNAMKGYISNVVQIGSALSQAQLVDLANV